MVTTFNATRDLTSDSSLTDALDFYKTKIFQQINTITLGKVIAVNNSTQRLQVQPLINGLNSENNPIIPPIIYDVPYGTIQGGTAGIITEFVVGDTVIIGFCQRQIDGTKTTGSSSTPSLLRYFSLQDAIVLAHWSNTLPTVFLKITNSEITIQATNNPITISTTGNININANNATITATNIALNGNVTMNSTLTIGSTVLNASGSSSIDGISFEAHKHTNVVTGGDLSGPVSPV